MLSKTLSDHQVAGSKLLNQCSIHNPSETGADLQISSIYLRHSIPDEARNKLLDWMIEVLCKCEASLNTFFVSVSILDRFFLLTDEILSKQNLHISGVVAMDLACKYENSNSVSLGIFKKEVAHNKFTMNQLLKMEIKILKTLQFNLNLPLPIDALRYISWKLSFPKKIIKISELLLILNRFDTTLQLSPIEESLTCLYLSCSSEDLAEDCLKLKSLCYSLNEDIEYPIICIQNKITQYKLSRPVFKCLYTYLRFEFESIEKKPFFQFFE